MTRGCGQRSSPRSRGRLACSELPQVPDWSRTSTSTGATRFGRRYADERGGGRSADNPVAATDDELVDMVPDAGCLRRTLNARPFTSGQPRTRPAPAGRLSPLGGHAGVGVDLRSASVATGSARCSSDEVPAHAASLAGDAQRPAGPCSSLAMIRRAAGQLPPTPPSWPGRTSSWPARRMQERPLLLRALINCVAAARATRHGGAGPGARAAVATRPAAPLNVRRAGRRRLSPDAGGGVSIGALVRRSRRHNPSPGSSSARSSGPEVVEMLSAMSQGNDGSLSNHPRAGGRRTSSGGWPPTPHSTWRD